MRAKYKINAGMGRDKCTDKSVGERRQRFLQLWPAEDTDDHIPGAPTRHRAWIETGVF